jgi:hypothetical protein
VEYTIGNLNPEKLTNYKAQTEDYINQKINVALKKIKLSCFHGKAASVFLVRTNCSSFATVWNPGDFSVEVIIYLRNWKDFIQSVFQQRIKGLRLDTFIPVPPHLNQD